MFACCLEDAHLDAAEESFAALVHTFFDWNEVRVTSISELSEVMACLPDPRAAANRIKRVLHAIFEATFNFDLEDLKKKNLGPTVTWLEKLDGTTPFVVAYVVQAALGGHAIPIDAGTMAVLRVLDLVTEKDAAAGAVPGLERAVAKSKGIEFGSLLHELGADYSANPYSADRPRNSLQIEPECASRLPKRRAGRAQRKPSSRRRRRSRPRRRSEGERKPTTAAAAKAAGEEEAAARTAPAPSRRPSRRKRKPPPKPAGKDAPAGRRSQKTIGLRAAGQT